MWIGSAGDIRTDWCEGVPTVVTVVNRVAICPQRGVPFQINLTTGRACGGSQSGRRLRNWRGVDFRSWGAVTQGVSGNNREVVIIV